MSSSTTNATDALDAVAGLDLESFKFSIPGIEFRMGEMPGFVTALPIRTMVEMVHDEIITRRDYEIEGIEPGQRAMSEDHVKKIKKGLKRHDKKLVTGCFTLAIDPKGVKIDDKRVSLDNEAHLNITKAHIRPGYRTYIVDAQHREKAVRDLWNETLEAVRQGELEAEELESLLRTSSIPVLFLFEGNKDEISRLFVTMASTRPISASLIAVMDREQFANRIGLEIALRAKLLGAERLAFQTSGATGDKLYSAAAVRAAAANIYIGFRDRSPDMREENLRAVFAAEGRNPDDPETVKEAADEIVELLDHAYERMDGWRQLKDGTLTPKEFRSELLHATPSGLYVLAGVLCAARLAPAVDPKHVIDLVGAEISWRRNDRVDVDGVQRHPNFEGTLVRTVRVLDDAGNTVGWKSSTAGGARTAYEAATKDLIKRLIELDPDLAEMESDSVLIEMGLKARRGRGRPRKS